MGHPDSFLRVPRRSLTQWNSLGMVGLLAALTTTVAAQQPVQPEPSSAGCFQIQRPVERLQMTVPSSRIITLEGKIPKFQLHDEQFVSATPLAENQIQLVAKEPGKTQINLWDTEDRHYTLDVTVTADAESIDEVLSQQFPTARLRIMPLKSAAVVDGTVTRPEDIERVIAIVEQFYPAVINNLRVADVPQVLLHTQIMEVSRTKLRKLGINWRLAGDGSSSLGLHDSCGHPSCGTPGCETPGCCHHDAQRNGESHAGFRTGLISHDGSRLIATLRRDNLVKLLAEPTVVTTHGRPAKFSSGGRVPSLINSAGGPVAVDYQPYGTSIDFRPFVIGPDRLHLEVRPQVSEPDQSRSIDTKHVSLSAFTSHCVETAIEMHSGQTLAIAGLLQCRNETDIHRVPVLGKLPVFGGLFRKTHHHQNEIELLITITPEIVVPAESWPDEPVWQISGTGSRSTSGNQSTGRSAPDRARRKD